MTKELDIKIPSFWKNRNGDKVCVFHSDDKYYYLITCGSITAVQIYKPNVFDYLIEPWTEPRSGEFWVNVYDEEQGLFALYPSKHDADNEALDHRLVCVKVTWTEGQGLEGVE